MKKTNVIKNVITFLVLALASMTLFSCAKKSDAAAAGGTASGTVQIRATWWGDTKRNDMYDSIVAEFEKENPGITVIREPASWVDYWDKLSVQAAGGNAPDFIAMHPQYAADYVPRGVIEPLEAYIADGTLSTEGWAQGTIDTGKFNGTLYMMPMGVTFSSVFINSSLFEELGVTPPDFDWTWDDMRAIGLKVRAALDTRGQKNVWLMTDVSSALNSWRYYVRQQGREIYDANGNINFTEGDVESWFALFKEFRDLGIVPDGATSTEYANAVLEDSLFARDKVLSLIIPINQYKLYRTTFPDKTTSFIRMPTGGAAKKVGEFPEGAFFAVNAKSTPEKKLAAAKLMNFWINSEKSLAIFGLDQGVPGNLKVGEVILPALDEYQKEIVGYVNRLSQIGTATIYPPSGASEIDALFKNFGEQVQFGAKTPAQAAREFYAQAVEIRSKAAK
jgi:multiple sugar transport system substrate-binding protein